MLVRGAMGKRISEVEVIDFDFLCILGSIPEVHGLYFYVVDFSIGTVCRNKKATLHEFQSSSIYRERSCAALNHVFSLMTDDKDLSP